MYTEKIKQDNINFKVFRRIRSLIEMCCCLLKTHNIINHVKLKVNRLSSVDVWDKYFIVVKFGIKQKISVCCCMVGIIVDHHNLNVCHISKQNVSIYIV